MKSNGAATRPPSSQVESTGYVGSEHAACRCVLSQLIRASVFCGASSSSVNGGEINNSQGDQINGAMIINAHEVHLHMRRSDSDAPRATPAVNKSNTSESAGDSPYASTSSTPDREQSSTLKESSVSTNSGM